MSASVSVFLEGKDTEPMVSEHPDKAGGPLSVFVFLHSLSIWGYDAAAFRRIAGAMNQAAEALEAAQQAKQIEGEAAIAAEANASLAAEANASLSASYAEPPVYDEVDF